MTTGPDAIASLLAELGLDEVEISERKAFLELDAADVAVLRQFRADLARDGEAAFFVDAFYAHLARFPRTQVLLRDDATVARLKRTQAQYFDRLLAGEYDEDYVQHRLRVGIAHERVGLSPTWYLGAYRKYLGALTAKAMQRYAAEPAHAERVIQAVLKIVLFDMALAMDTYMLAAQRTIRGQAATDALTGLANRRLLEQQLTRERSRAERGHAPLAVVMADIDHFKRVNDTHGHSAGDEVLKELAQRFRAQARDIDVVARYGGEEFLFLLPGTDPEGARRFAERVRQAVAQTPVTLVNGQTLTVTVSLGVSAYSRDADSVDGLIACADRSLYRAKAQGRNCVVACDDAPDIERRTC
jgi:diguanylate cyclase (GGDEF)-like protein